MVYLAGHMNGLETPVHIGDEREQFSVARRLAESQRRRGLIYP
jgi:hypothetical protein